MKNKGTQGGFHIGNVGGNVDMKAGGDIVGGNKTVKEIQRVLASEQGRSEADRHLVEFAKALEDIRAEVAKAAELSAAEREQLVSELGDRLSKLESARETIVQPPPAEAGGELAKGVETTLEHAGKALDRVREIGGKSAALAVKIAGMVTASGAALDHLRRLLGF